MILIFHRNFEKNYKRIIFYFDFLFNNQDGWKQEVHTFEVDAYVSTVIHL